MTKQKYIFFVFVLFVFLFILSYSTNSNSIDPDFGWHLRTGQLILERGVPKVDWYSYTMSNFSWIDHEWLTEVFIYKIYSFLGYPILLAGFLAIFILAFIVSIKKEKFFYFLFPVIIGYLATLGFLGIRPQLLSVFFIAVLLIILNKFFENPSTKWIYFCPILFLIWANLHGGFIIGLFIIFLYLILEIFKKTRLFKKIISSKIFSGQNFKEGPKGQPNKKIKGLLILLILSAVFTFINPYGPGLYRSVDFTSMGDSFLKSHIVEWEPLFTTSPFNLIIFIILYLAFFLSLIIVFYKRIEFNNLFLSFVFLFSAISSQRNLLIFIILTIPIFAELLFCLKSEIFKSKINRQNVEFIFSGFRKYIIILIILGLFIFGFYPYLDDNIKAASHSSYPTKAVDFLRTLPLSENLFNEYNWGGYLIWKLPERKVFIDGRMPSWREGRQFTFGDYVKMMYAQKGSKRLLEKYNIKIVLLQKSTENQAIKYTNYQNKPENQLTNFFKKHGWLSEILGINFPSKNIYNELIGSGWHIIYQDSTAVILEK